MLERKRQSCEKEYSPGIYIWKIERKDGDYDGKSREKVFVASESRTAVAASVRTRERHRNLDVTDELMGGI